MYYALDVRGSDTELMNESEYDAKKDKYKVDKKPTAGYTPCEDSIGDLSFAPIYADPPRTIRLRD